MLCERLAPARSASAGSSPSATRRRARSSALPRDRAGSSAASSRGMARASRRVAIRSPPAPPAGRRCASSANTASGQHPPRRAAARVTDEAVSAIATATPSAVRQSSPTTNSHRPQCESRASPLIRRPAAGRARLASARPARRSRCARARSRGEQHAGTIASSARSPPGQSAPAPSAAQNIPNEQSITPTANFIVFSGTRASGARSASPRARHGEDRDRRGRRGEADMRCWLAPKVSTMKATSRPSSSTPLKAIETRRCRTPPRIGGELVGRLRLFAVDRELVVLRLHSAGAQDRLAQPLQAEVQQQPADEHAQHADRQRRERRDRACAMITASASTAASTPAERRGPAARDADGEHDRERLDALDRAGEVAPRRRDRSRRRSSTASPALGGSGLRSRSAWGLTRTPCMPAHDTPSRDAPDVAAPENTARVRPQRYAKIILWTVVREGAALLA